VKRLDARAVQYSARATPLLEIGQGLDNLAYSAGVPVCTAWTFRVRAGYAPPMPQPFVSREQWSDVTAAEFEAFLHAYPRPLEARPPVSRRANYREWIDPSLGQWPENAVAKSWTRGHCHGYQIRLR
jgi:hypothetical protein